MKRNHWTYFCLSNLSPNFLCCLFIFQFNEEDECKVKRHDGEAGEVQTEMIVKSEKGKNSKETLEAKNTDFIHVRARRGQATDSHSLAERVSLLLH